MPHPSAIPKEELPLAFKKLVIVEELLIACKHNIIIASCKLINMTDPSRGEFVKAGYLIKSPPDFKAKVAQWHRRWFLLMDSKLVYPLASRYVRLEYYQSEAEAKRLADPKGMDVECVWF